MPLQNRVTPFGEIEALPARGLLMGNRGILHDDNRHLVRSWQVRRWIACRTVFRGRHRQLMRPHSYTELFFLDEATALAAGHRPCAECRHADFLRFKVAWQAWSGSTANAPTMDALLHHDRLAGRGSQQRQRTYTALCASLPDGTFIARDGLPWLLWRGWLLRWSAAGYSAPLPIPATEQVVVLTPSALVATLQAGYLPLIHPSAEAAIAQRA